MLFDAGQSDALQQGMWQYFCYYAGGIFLKIGVRLVETCIRSIAGAFEYIMRLSTCLPSLTENVSEYLIIAGSILYWMNGDRNCHCIVVVMKTLFFSLTVSHGRCLNLVEEEL